MRTSALWMTLLFVGAALAVGNAEEQDSSAKLKQLEAKLKAAVKSGKMTQEEAIKEYYKVAKKLGIDLKRLKDFDKGDSKRGIQVDVESVVFDLFRRVQKGELTAEQAMAKYKAITRSSKRGARRSPTAADLTKLKELDKILPKNSTAADQEGPASTFIFGWAANATHRFMDNSHRGKPRKIRGLSFRLDYRNHNAIGRTWKNVTVRIAHGDFSSIRYNRSKEFKLVDQALKVFDKHWSFPTVKGFPPLKPASWGGPKNSLRFRFDTPWEYNGKDAIYVEFKFRGGVAEDGREWKGELPFGFEYYLDSMPEVGGWRVAKKDGFDGPIYTKAARVPAVTSYTADGQSVWTSAAKGMPYIRWEE